MSGETLKLSSIEVKNEIEHINKLATDVQNDSQELIEVATRCIERGIQTEWAQNLLVELRQFQNGQVQEAIADIKLQAQKLAEASEKATAYSQEQM